MVNAIVGKFKKTGAIILVLGIICTSTPCFAIKNNKETLDKKDYINLEFWEKYNDENLNFYILKAVELNHDLKIAKENTEIYKNLITIQKAQELPTIGAGFAPAYNKLPYSTNSSWLFTLPVYVNWEADIFLKNKDKISASKKDFEISLLDEKSAYISIAGAVGSVYFNILKLEKAIEIQEEIISLRAEILRLMTLQNNEGLISYQDVIAADRAYIKGKSDLEEFKKQKSRLINALAVLTGENPNNADSFYYSDLEKINFSGNIPKIIPSSAITYRPDYIKAEKKVEKSGINVKVAKKEFLPTINLTGLAFFNAAKLSSLFTTENALTSLGGGIFTSLFTGGKKISNLKIKKSEYKIALQEYEKTNLTALQEVNDAMSAINHDEIKLSSTEKQNNLEIKNYGLKELKYNEGVISKLDLIQAKENLLSTHLLYLFDKTECFIDYITLYKALGAKTDIIQ